MPGIARSRSTASGCVSATTPSTSSPRSATPATSSPSSASEAVNARTNSGWSSATTNLATVPPPVRRLAPPSSVPCASGESPIGGIKNGGDRLFSRQIKASHAVSLPEQQGGQEAAKWLDTAPHESYLHPIAE